MDEVVKVGAVMAMVLGVPALAVFLIQSVRRMLGSTDRAGTAHRDDDVRTLRAEIEELRDLVPRMAELEERVDFAERMLARQREDARLTGGSDASA